MFVPDQLTGALVREVRDAHKLSREQFSQLAGFTGKSTARLNNIERKDSWKPGDREAVATALNRLEPNFDPRWHHILTSTNGAALTDGGPIYVRPFDDDEVDDALASVPTVEPTIEDRPPETPPIPDLVLNVSSGSYLVSNSELQTWKRCRRKWWFAWYRRLALQTETFVGVRATGDRVHRALQQWYVPDGRPRVDPRDALERVVVEDWTKISNLARERGLDDDHLARLATEFGQSTNLERAMIEGYVQWLEETGADAELRVIASETPLSANLEVVDDRGETRPVTMIGRLDVRVTRVTDDVNLFIDHKTVGDLKSPAVTLPQNEQMTHYMLLEWLNTPEGERRCDGALYNMLKRSKRTGRATPPFYDRVEVRHNPYELAAYRRRLLGATRNIINTIDALDRGASHLDVVYPSPRGECKWDCDFFAVCNLYDDGSAGVDDMVDALYHEVDPRERYSVVENDHT